MTILNLADYRRSASAHTRPAPSSAPAPIVDRWAILHSPAVAAPTSVARDFWTDLQFRMAYPTHRERQH